MRDLSALIKAYDIRGVVPDQWGPDLAREVGTAFVEVLGIRSSDGGAGRIVVGHDMRPTGPDLVAAFIDGVTAAGVDVVNIGLCSTDGLYFASGKLDIPGAMFTASHNPAEYNGIKLCLSGARPIGKESGLLAIENFVRQGSPMYIRSMGVEKEVEMLTDYVDYLLSLVDISEMRRLKIVVDAGNGMAGYTAPAIFERLNVELIPLYFELDGTFPNHEANPIDPKNLRDLQKAVKKHNADLGLAFDGDADRCFLVDENGETVNPSDLTCLVAARELARVPGSTIIYNLISSRAVLEVIEENSGTGLRSRVGHSYIKKMMADSGAIFGGEHSGHFYFKDFWRADSGALAALHAIAALGSNKASISKILKPYQRYVSSGEINSVVSDAPAEMKKIEEKYGSQSGVEIDRLDGLSVNGDTWWFNLRSSNTEPLLRLNVEAKTQARMEKVRDEVLKAIKGK